jgi:signal peptidase I
VSTTSWTTRISNLPVPQRSTIHKALSGLWLGLAFCALGLAGYQVASGQWHATPVLSGSMRPGVQPGDVVVTQRVAISDLHVRDVVVFHPPDEGDRLTVHRIVKLTAKGGTTSITTWGDANTVADAAVSSLAGTTAYRVVRVVPLLGYPAMWLQNGDHGKLAIALGVILLIAAGTIVLRPDKPTKPTGPADNNGDPANPADSDDDRASPGDNSDDPLEVAAR